MNSYKKIHELQADLVDWTNSEKHSMGDRKKRKIENSPRSDDVVLSEPFCEPYEIKNGLRFVKPYSHVFETFVKKRWLGRELLEMMANEFEAFDEEYYRDAIDSGRIKVNGEIVSHDFVLKDNQKIRHEAMMLEPPVLFCPIRILSKININQSNSSFEIIAVDKPCGIPIHPGAAYRFNSLIEIVRHRSHVQCRDYEVINEHAIRTFNAKLIEDLRLKKIKIPKEPPKLSELTTTQFPCLFDTSALRPLHRLDRLTSGIVAFGTTSDVAREFELKFREGKIFKTYLARVVGNFSSVCKSENLKPESALLKFTLRGEVHCVNRKSSLYKFEKSQSIPKGKMSETEFEFVCYDSELDESIVLMRPHTGRTHQLRTQLLYLGHPISNDPCYGPSKQRHIDWFQRVPHVNLNHHNTSIGNSFIENATQQLHASGIFLHAWKYSMTTSDFETELPNWVSVKHQNPSD